MARIQGVLLDVDGVLHVSMSPLAGAAAELHEMFTSCINAGFTRKEALYLVGKYLAAVVVARNQAAAGDEDDG